MKMATPIRRFGVRRHNRISSHLHLGFHPHLTAFILGLVPYNVVFVCSFGSFLIEDVSAFVRQSEGIAVPIHSPTCQLAWNNVKKFDSTYFPLPKASTV